MHYANYIIISSALDFQTHTYFANNREELECILKMCTLQWCHNPYIEWEDNTPPKFKKLFKACLKEENFGDIATVLEYDSLTDTYFEWSQDYDDYDDGDDDF